ncbi:MAG: hypothetical protein B7Z59_13375, partial [Acidiphilium sp. 37-67-22]
IPLDAITAFADPAVRFGLQFTVREADAPEEAPAPETEPAPPPAEQGPAEVVSLDAFRRRPPAKD